MILTYARQLSGNKSDINREEQVRISTKVNLRSLETIKVQNDLYVWEFPERYPPTHIFPPHILYHLSMYVVKESF